MNLPDAGFAPSMQTDIHSPQTTIREALLFSASLRLQGDLSPAAIGAFVDEVTRVVELVPLQNALVGVPGQRHFTQKQCAVPHNL